MRLVAAKCLGIAWVLLACVVYAQDSPPAADATSARDSLFLEMLDESVEYLSERLPFQIDISTRLVAVSREGRTLVYRYQVERVSRGELERHARVLGQRTCRNQQLLDLLNTGGAVRYSYGVKESGQRVVHEITLRQCEAPEIVL